MSTPTSVLLQSKVPIGYVILLILFPLILYFNVLQGAFQFDDRNLLDREWIFNLDTYEKSVELTAYENRPVLLWTYAVNNTLHRNRVLGFHLTNLTLHIFVTVLVFFILVRSGHFLSTPQGRSSFSIPFTAALLFTAHPLNTDSVSYISSRSSLLVTFFYLLTLYIFLEMFSVRRSRFKWLAQTGLAILTLVGMYLALASKLTALTLPVLLCVWFLAFICPSRYPRLRAFLFNKITIASFVVSALALAALAVFRYPHLLYSPKDQGLELFGRIPYFFVQIKIIVFHYIHLFLFPVNLNVDSGFPFSTFPTDLKIVLAILLIAGIMVWVFKAGKTWLTAGTLWFFLTLAPTSSFIPLNDLAVEHRTYLPITLGLCMILGWALAWMPPMRRCLLAILLLTSFGLLTISRNTVWFDEYRLWSDSAKKSPYSPRTHNNLGKTFYEKGKINQALFHFEKSVKNIPAYISSHYNLRDNRALMDRIDPTESVKNPLAFAEMEKEIRIHADFIEPHYNLANVYLDLGRLDDAERAYKTALELDGNIYQAHLGLGSVYNFKGNFKKAIESFRLAIEKRRTVTGAEDYPLARVNLGEVFGKQGRYKEALGELKRAVKLDPSLPLAHFNLGTAYLQTKDLENAELSFETCLRLNDRFEPAIFNLARVYQEKKEWGKSIKQFEKYILLKGPRAGALAGIAWNHQKAGRADQARAFYEKTLEVRPDHLPAHYHLGKLLAKAKKYSPAKKHFKEALKLKPPPKMAKEISRRIKKLSSR